MSSDLIVSKIKTENESVNIYKIEGRIDAETSYYFDDELKKISELKNILLDFEKVNYMNSFGIGILVDLQKRVMKNGGIIKICHLSPSLKKIFQITYLTKVFEIYEDLNSALEKF
jgi:anti-anti-sigma factor